MGAVTTAVSTVLGLTLLQTLTVGESASRVGSLLRDVDHLLERALDPTVPAIPDRSVHGPAKTGGTVPKANTKTKTTTPTKAPTKSTVATTTIPRLPIPGQQRAV